MLVEVPAGYSLGNPAIDIIPYAYGVFQVSATETLGAASYSNSFQIDGERVGRWIETPKNLWSDTCSDPTRGQVVELGANIEVALGDGTYFTGLSIVFDLTLAGAKTQWRQCSSDKPLDRPGVPEGSRCDDRDRHCEADLTCDLEDTSKKDPSAPREGTCRSGGDDADTAPSLKNERCGGVRQLRCDVGLTCHYTSRDAEQQKLLGVCTPAVGTESERCGGYPDVPCADKLLCHGAEPDVPVRFCRRADGSKDATCGPGMPSCQAGYECVRMQGNDICRPRIARVNQPCGEGVATCQIGTFCDDGSNTCKPLEPGGLGDYCHALVPCRPEFECRDQECVGPTTGMLGSPCTTSNMCRGELVCGDRTCREPGTLPSGSPCAASFECLPNHFCVHERCSFKADGTLGAKCAIDAQCAAEFDCIQGLCAPRTSGDTTILSL